MAFISSHQMPKIPKPDFKAPPAALARRPSPEMPTTSTPAVKTPPAAVARRLSHQLPETATPAVETPPAAGSRHVSHSAVEDWFNISDLPSSASTEGPAFPEQGPPPAMSSAAAVTSLPKPPPPQLPDDFESDFADDTLPVAHVPLPQFLQPPAAPRTSAENSPVPATPCAVAPHLPAAERLPPPAKFAYASETVPAASPPCTAPLPCAAAPMDTTAPSVPVVHAWDAVAPTPARQPALSTAHASPPAAAARGPPPALPPTFVTRDIAPPSATNLRARKWGLCCSAKRWRSMVFGIGIIQLCRTGSSYPTRRHPLGFIISQLCRRRTKILSSKMVSLLPLEWPPSSTNWILTQAFPVWISRLGDRTVSLTSVSTQAVLAPTMLSPSTIPLAWQLTLAEITLRSDEGRLSFAMGHDAVLCGCATSCDNAVLCGCATSCDTAIDTPFWVLRLRAQLPILTCLPRTLSWRLVACEEKTASALSAVHTVWGRLPG